MGEIASAHVSIYPKFSSTFGSTVSQQVGAAGTKAGSQFSTNLGKSAAKGGGALKGMFTGVKAGIVGLVASATVGVLVDGFNDLTDGASNLNETVNKSKSVFGDSYGSMDKWAKGAYKSVGLSKQAALDATSSFGDMFTQLGFGRGEAAKMSKSTVQLAADLGSYNNLPTADVSERISAAFRGEYDSLQKVIPNINAARVEKEALAATGKKNAKSLTAEEKATAVLAIVTRDGAKAAGDFAKTSGDVANKTKILESRQQNLSDSFGKMLLPMKQVALDGFGQLVSVGEGFTKWLEKNPAVMEGVSAALDLIGGALKTVGGVIVAVAVPTLSLLVKGFAAATDGLAWMLEGLGSIPGWGWATEAAGKLRKVALGARAVADGLDSIGKEKPKPYVIKVEADRKKATADLVKLVGKKRAAKIIAEANTTAGRKALEKLVGKKRTAAILAKAYVGDAEKAINHLARTRTVAINPRIAVAYGGLVPGFARGGAVGFAPGGRVTGWSPHDRADNIPANLTAGEFVHPVDAVRHYGVAAMEAIRRRKAVVSFADGGAVAAGAGGGMSGGATFNLFDADGVLLGSMRGEIARNQSHNRTVARMGAR